MSPINLYLIFIMDFRIQSDSVMLVNAILCKTFYKCEELQSNYLYSISVFYCCIKKLQTQELEITNILFHIVTKVQESRNGVLHDSGSGCLIKLQLNCLQGLYSLKAQLEVPLPRSVVQLLAGGFCSFLCGMLHETDHNMASSRVKLITTWLPPPPE